jgi:hypothetical protein
VPALTFTVSTGAEFIKPKPKRPSIREILWRAQNIALGKTTELNGGQRPGERINPQRSALEDRNHHAFREELIANVNCPSNSVAEVRNATYRRYLISTTLRLNGTWVASYGRQKVQWPSANGLIAVAETEPYLAEALALADARTRIDERRCTPPPRIRGRRQRQRTAPAPIRVERTDSRD